MIKSLLALLGSQRYLPSFLHTRNKSRTSDQSFPVALDLDFDTVFDSPMLLTSLLSNIGVSSFLLYEGNAVFTLNNSGKVILTLTNTESAEQVYAMSKLGSVNFIFTTHNEHVYTFAELEEWRYGFTSPGGVYVQG